MKVCKKCGETKELHEFSKHNSFRDGRNCRCKACKNEEARLLYLKNGQRESSKYNYERQIKTRYGLSQQAYDTLLKEQGNACALCGNETTLVIDHDHETGAVRGLLCIRCNTGLGKLGDNADALRRALEYLERLT